MIWSEELPFPPVAGERGRGIEGDQRGPRPPSVPCPAILNGSRVGWPPLPSIRLEAEHGDLEVGAGVQRAEGLACKNRKPHPVKLVGAWASEGRRYVFILGYVAVVALHDTQTYVGGTGHIREEKRPVDQLGLRVRDR